MIRAAIARASVPTGTRKPAAKSAANSSATRRRRPIHSTVP